MFIHKFYFSIFFKASCKLRSFIPSAVSITLLHTATIFFFKAIIYIINNTNSHSRFCWLILTYTSITSSQLTSWSYFESFFNRNSCKRPISEREYSYYSKYKRSSQNNKFSIHIFKGKLYVKLFENKLSVKITLYNQKSLYCIFDAFQYNRDNAKN